MQTRKSILALVALSIAPRLEAQTWDFLYQQDAINVYGDHGSPRSYKAEGFMDANILELMSVLADVPRRTEWVRGLAATRVIAGNPDDHVWLYSRYDLPWPAHDRDSVIESTIQKDYANNEITVIFKATELPSVPPRADAVRLRLADGIIYFKGLTDQRLFIRYQMITDPGGLLPEWITQYFTKDVPINTLIALRNQVEKTRGQYTDFIKKHRLLMEKARGI